MTTSYSVSGMTCQGCAKAVTNAIMAASSQAKVEVDLEAKNDTVEGFDDDTAIGKAVVDAGFDFGGAIQ